MEKQIAISIEDINVLRKTFKQAEDIINRLGAQLGSETTPESKPKETKTQKINKYSSLISSGQRAKKPNHLKK